MRSGAQIDLPAEVTRDSEEAPRQANRLSVVPLSATGSFPMLALGVGALIYGRFGRQEARRRDCCRQEQACP